MTNRTRAAVGELRTDHLKILDATPDVDILCAAPGLLPRLFAGHSDLARWPEQRMPTAVAHGWRGAALDFFAEQVDALPQTPAWENCIRGWVPRLQEGRARVLHQQRVADLSRLLCVDDRALLFSGPLTLGTSDSKQGLRFELTGPARDEALRWFDAEAGAGEDISREVAGLLAESWAYSPAPAEDLYFKILADYFGSTLSALDREVDANPLLDLLTEFQEDAYHYAKGVLRRYGGVFLSDVVGLGKTWIAMALLKHLQDRYGHHAVVVAPPAVCPTWEDLAHEHRVELVTLSIGKLDEIERHIDREVLVIDESHNFRNTRTRRYDVVSRWLRPGGEPSARQVLLLSATPQNNDPIDVLNQVRLFPDNYTRLPFRGESLDDWFRRVREGTEDLRDLLQHVVVRRTRGFIKAAYPDATLRRKRADGTSERVPLRFPVRVSGAEQCLRYQLDRDTDGQQIYDGILDTLGRMAYPLFGLGAYVLEEYADEPQVAGLRSSGKSLRGIYKSLLLKRLESSLHAFGLSVSRLAERVDNALVDLDGGQVVVRESTDGDRADELADDPTGPVRVPAKWFDAPELRRALEADRAALGHLLDLGARLRSSPDAKLSRLEEWLRARPPTAHRTIIFSQFADTAWWLASELGQRFGRAHLVTGSTPGKLTIVRRFAPMANRAPVPEDDQIDLLVSTDALSEGVNLQDADTLINFDLHWNPVRLIQRAGRIDRIGSENEEIWIASFLPERGLEAGLRLEEVLRRRIDEFLRVFGEDSSILPDDEKPQEAAMVASFTGDALRDADANDEMDGLSRHVNRILALRREQPDRFDRVVAMRAGRRAWSTAEGTGVVACRLGWYWNFWSVGGGAELVDVDDLEGLDRLFALASAGDAPPPDGHDAGLVAEAARAAFAPRAREFRQQRIHPALTAPELFVLESLAEYRRGALGTQRVLIDAVEAWVRAGTAKAVLQREARRWKKGGLSPHAVFHEVRAWYRRYPSRDDDLGEPELAGLMLPASRS